ncbi:MAG: CoA transferase [Streptosporangiales bacterium]|nr:CoA transferase [Streptosporangiales bacterium]
MRRAMSRRPLEGIVVADLSRVLAGPFATMMLADLGAEVIKVEHPERGDDTRAWGPPDAGGEAAYYLALNRGKQGLAIDVKDPDGLRIVQDLCDRADVVIENFRPGVADRLGLGSAAVRERNPGVVYCSISGFGARRKPADRPGFDAVIQAESGLMHITGEESPTKVGVAITDVLTAFNATVAILAALRHRDRTGEGDHIDVSLLGSALAGLTNVTQSAIVSGQEAKRYGSAHPSVVPYQPFPTADGEIMIAAGNDALYRKLCEVIGRPELGDDPRFATNADRIRNRDALISQIIAELRAKDGETWTNALLEAGVPVGKIRGVREALAAAAEAGDPATFTVEHPTAGPLELVRNGFELAGMADAPPPAPPPLLGQHTRDVLTWLGLTAPEITALEDRRVVRQAPLEPTQLDPRTEIERN